MRSALILAILALVLRCPASAAGIVAVSLVSPAPGEPISAGELIEVRVDLDRSYANPFDPDDVHVRALIDNGLDEFPPLVGFWFQDYLATSVDGVERVSEVGSPHFRIRLRAWEGTWKLWIRAADADGEDGADALDVHVLPAEPAPRGFVRRLSGTGRGLTWSNGEPYVPFGANVCWVGYDEGVAGFERYFDRLAENDLNWTRVWMTHFDATALEWSAGDEGAYQGLGRYNLRAAWRVDRILQLAEDRGIAVQLVLQQHSQFETSNWSSWAENPWNQANGGPLATSGEFFTNAGVIDAFDAKLTYLAARYAHSPGLLAWELFNEVELIDGARRADFDAWSRERAAYLKLLSPYRHPVTTSYASACWAGCTQPWGDDAYDIAQVHSYLPDYWMALRKAARNMLKVGKPVIAGEVGIDFLGEKNKADAAGTHLVNMTLLAAMLGFDGGAMSWWWDNWLEPNGLWSVLGNAARALKAVRIEQWSHVVEARVTANVPLEVVAAGGFGAWEGQAGTGIVVWLHDPTSEWDGPGDEGAFPEITVDCLELPSFSSDFCDRPAATLADPRTGEVVARDEAGYLGLPPFRRDLLVAFECPPPPCGWTGGEPGDPRPEVDNDASTEAAPTEEAAGDVPMEAFDAADDERPAAGGCSVPSFR